MELVKLKNITSILTGFSFKGELYSDEGIRVVRGENITEGRLRWDTIKCWNLPFDKKDYYSLKKDDVVIGMDGSKVGKNKCRIKKENLPLLLAQRVACIRSNETLHQVFLYYCIDNIRFEEYVFRIQTGSSVPHISKTQIEDFSIPFPDLQTQKSIAKVLSDLDTKIELNNKINQELEAMAKTLYDYWFVQFDFPNEQGKPYKSSGGKMVFNAELKREVPVGWGRVKLGDVGKVSMCKRIHKHETFIDEEIPFYKISTFGKTADVFISRKIFNEYKTKYSYPKKGDILISAAGTIGKIVIFDGVDSFFQDSNIVWIDNDETFTSNAFLYYFYQSKPWVTTTGSTIKRLYNEDLRNISFAYPSVDIVTQNENNISKKFSNIVSSFLSNIIKNQNQNQQLTALRDWLLPMLMNGQVTVN